jgi:hypothetical protein
MSNKCDKIKRKCKYERYKMNKNADKPQEVGTGDLISTEEILTNLKVDISRLENENENLKETNLEMKNEILQLLSKVSEEPVIETFSEGKFSNDIREVIMSLFSCGVSQAKVKTIIETVMSKFSGKRLSHFPSAGWPSNLRSEMSFFSKKSDCK